MHRKKRASGIFFRTHYYPFGLPIYGMGSTAAGFKENRRKYQSNEYIKDLGLNWMDFNFRQYDPQIGRFLGVDMLADYGGQDMYSPYAAMGNAPESMIDPDGLTMSKSPAGGYTSHEYARSGAGDHADGGGGGALAGLSGNPSSGSLWGGTQFGNFSYMGMTGQILENYYHNHVEERSMIDGELYGSGKMITNYYAQTENVSGGTLLPEVTVRGRGHIWGWGKWRQEMAKKFGINNPLTPEFEQFDYDQGWKDPWVRASRLGYSPKQVEIHDAFDALGLIPVGGEIFDGANAALYSLEGDYANAALSSAAMVPIVGWGATALKFRKAAKAGKTFFEGASYSSKVARQMSNAGDIFHAFPQSVDGFATKFGQWSTKVGADGNTYQWLEMGGSYGGKTGTFEYIKDANGIINHRFFNVPR